MYQGDEENSGRAGNSKKAETGNVLGFLAFRSTSPG